MAKVGFLGTGEIAEAMVLGLLGDGHDILVSDRSKARAEKLGLNKEVVITDNQGVLSGSDIVVLCLLKDVAQNILPSLKFRDDHKVISVMVDVPYPNLSELCAPSTDISVTIPLPFISTGGCPLPCFPNEQAVSALWGDKNPAFAVVDEASFNAHFAATAMASVTFDQARVAANWLSTITNDPKNAEIYLSSLLGGFFSELPKDEGALVTALQSVSTEGGLNATLRAHMEDGGVLAQLEDGLDGFRDRLGLPSKS